MSHTGRSPRATVRAYLDALNRGDADDIADCVSDGFINEHTSTLGETIVGREAYHKRVSQFLQTFADLHYDTETLIVDGDEGRVVLRPRAETLAEYRRRQGAHERDKRVLARLSGLPAVTRDGTDIALFANLELPRELAAGIEAGAQGVGLLRTEFMFMNRDSLPDEEEQYRALRKLTQLVLKIGLLWARRLSRSLKVLGEVAHSLERSLVQLAAQRQVHHRFLYRGERLADLAHRRSLCAGSRCALLHALECCRCEGIGAAAHHAATRRRTSAARPAGYGRSL